MCVLISNSKANFTVTPNKYFVRDLASFKPKTKLCNNSRGPLGDTVPSVNGGSAAGVFSVCLFFQRKMARKNDVIISKDKWHSGTYTFILETVSAGMWRRCWLIPE